MGRAAASGDRGRMWKPLRLAKAGSAVTRDASAPPTRPALTRGNAFRNGCGAGGRGNGPVLRPHAREPCARPGQIPAARAPRSFGRPPAVPGFDARGRTGPEALQGHWLVGRTGRRGAFRHDPLVPAVKFDDSLDMYRCCAPHGNPAVHSRFLSARVSCGCNDRRHAAPPMKKDRPAPCHFFQRTWS